MKKTENSSKNNKIIDSLINERKKKVTEFLNSLQDDINISEPSIPRLIGND